MVIIIVTAGRVAVTARSSSSLLLRRHFCAAAAAAAPQSSPISKITRTSTSHLKSIRSLHITNTPYPSFVPPTRALHSSSRKLLSATYPSRMSDEDYSNFLAKSQKDYSKQSSSTAAQSSSKRSGGVSSSSYPSIKNIGDDRHYSSESDEPFEEVAIDWEETRLPDAKSFAELVNADEGDVDVCTSKEWDPKGQYEDVTKAVSEAGKGGEVKVYKAPGQGARVIYYIVAVNKGHGKLVGVKVTAVES